MNKIKVLGPYQVKMLQLKHRGKCGLCGAAFKPGDLVQQLRIPLRKVIIFHKACYDKRLDESKTVLLELKTA